MKPGKKVSKNKLLTNTIMKTTRLEDYLNSLNYIKIRYFNNPFVFKNLNWLY